MFRKGSTTRESRLGCLSAIPNHLELQAVVQESKTKHCLPTRKLFKAVWGWLRGTLGVALDYKRLTKGT